MKIKVILLLIIIIVIIIIIFIIIIIGFNDHTAFLKTCCYLLLLLRLINVCLSNNEALSKWMEVLETEAVFKNFIYILENSLNGQFRSIKNCCFNIAPVNNFVALRLWRLGA